MLLDIIDGLMLMNCNMFVMIFLLFFLFLKIFVLVFEERGSGVKNIFSEEN